MWTEGRWLTVSIYLTSLPCQGRVPSLCMSPSFPVCIPKAGKTRLPTLFETAALTTELLTHYIQVHSHTHARTQDKIVTMTNETTLEKWHTYDRSAAIEQPVTSWPLSTVDFSTAVTLKLLLLTHTLRNERHKRVSLAVCEERTEQRRLTCLRLHCLLSCGEL